MADRYAINGDWNLTSTWSATSGGATGASVPTATDNVFCDANTVLLNMVGSGNNQCRNFDCTGMTGSITGSDQLQVTGEICKLPSAGTYTCTSEIILLGSNAVGDVVSTRSGRSTNQGYTFNGAGQTFKLADDHNLGSGNFIHTNGTFNSQGFDITCAVFNLSNTNTRTATFTGSDIVCGNAAINATNLTFASPASLTFFSQVSPTSSFGLAGVTLEKVNIQRNGAPTNRMGGSFTVTTGGTLVINELAFIGVEDANWVSCVLRFPNDVRIDKCSFPEGTELISSANGTQRTITTNTDEISFDGCMIRDIVIAGSEDAIATGCIDLGNNEGITFSDAPAPSGGSSGTMRLGL